MPQPPAPLAAAAWPSPARLADSSPLPCHPPEPGLLPARILHCCPHVPVLPDTLIKHQPISLLPTPPLAAFPALLKIGAPPTNS